MFQNKLFNVNDHLPELAEDETPQYKAERSGMYSLSNTELICLCIQGSSRKAVDSVRAILEKANHNLKALAQLSIGDLTKIEGIGKSKALSIVAAIELGRRKEISNHLNRPTLTASRDAADIFTSLLADNNVEQFAVMFLNQASKIIATEIFSTGGISGTVADPRVLLKRALELNATSIIVSHNHPSGSLKPSPADEGLTVKIKEAAKYFDIRLLDHIIVSQAGFFSFCDEGLL